MQLAFKESPHYIQSISPLQEMGAYESLWLQSGMSFKRLAQHFQSHPGSVPSDFVDPETAYGRAAEALNVASEQKIEDFGVRVHGAGEYPQKLRDAKHPIELLYYRGYWDLTETPSVAVVGTRHPTESGKARTRKLAHLLVRSGYTVVSGLAQGIDTEAHMGALDAGGNTIAVVGTSILRAYPKANAQLQEYLANRMLVVSQVPILRYETQTPRTNRFFFPERNITMSALTEATVIVEAGNTSGTLIQARAALAQGRKLFILKSCFEKPDLTWPKKFEEKGAIRVNDFDDIERHLANDKVNAN